MPGPAPKPASQRQRRNRITSAAVVEAPRAVGVELPADYHTQTHAWWVTIWGSPIAEEWVDADVPGLVALAQLVEDFWRAEASDRAKRHGEVRMAGREYGLSPFSRRQLQWEVRRVESAKRPVAAPPSRRATRSTLSVLEGRAG